MDSSPSHQIPDEEEYVLAHRSIPGLRTILQCGKTILDDSYPPKLSASPGLDTTTYVGHINRMFSDSLQTFDKSQVEKNFFKEDHPKQSTQILPQADPVITKSANFSIFHDPYGVITDEARVSSDAKRVLTENNNMCVRDSPLLSIKPLTNPETNIKPDSIADHASMESMGTFNTMSMNTTVTSTGTADTIEPVNFTSHKSSTSIDQVQPPTNVVEIPDLDDTRLFELINQVNVPGDPVACSLGNLSILNSPTALLQNWLNSFSKNPHHRNKFA